MHDTLESDLKDQVLRVSAAFTRQAETYDNYEIDNENLARVRNEVYQHVLRFLKPTDKMLEINAGTGTDARYFAQKGYRVHATDVAAGMVEKIEGKARQYNLGTKLTAQQLSFTALHEAEGAPYQYCFSNIGGLNCIPDLAEFTSGLPAVLAPGGVVTLVVMPTICLWEWLAVLKGKFDVARRRFTRGGVTVSPKGVPYKIYYHRPGRAIAAFGPRFRLLKLQSLSLFAPPIDRSNFSKRWPRLYRFLVRLDNTLTHRFPFNRWGDFIIVSMQYAP